MKCHLQGLCQRVPESHKSDLAWKLTFAWKPPIVSGKRKEGH